MTLLYLVRHALTIDTGRRLSGWTPGIHLSDQGRAQAASLADRLKDVDFAAIYSSPLERTMETARAIASGRGVRVRSRASVGEVDFGEWTNRPLKTLARTKLWSRVQRFPSGARFPGGESLMEVQSRALAEIEQIRRRHPDEKVCVVTHGEPIRLIVAHYLGAHLDLFQRIHVGPASVSILAIGDEGPHVLALNVPVDGLGR